MELTNIDIIIISLLVIVALAMIACTVVNYYIFKAIRELRKSIDALYSAIENIDTNLQHVKKSIQDEYDSKDK